MEALTPASPVHYYDTQLRRILCGLHGVEHRFTKRSREVTCPACVGLLRDRRAAGARSTPVAPGGGASA